MCNKTNKKLALCITRDKLMGVKIEKQNDRLEILKTKCEQEIQDTEEKLRVLKAKLANLVTLAQESEKLANPESEPYKYSDTGLTEAVYDAVKVLWNARGGGASATEIKNFLLARGFKAGENFGTAIYTVLNRLCESNRVIWYNPDTPIDRRAKLAGIPRRRFYKPK